MRQQLHIKLPPAEAVSPDLIKSHIQQHLAMPADSVTGFNILRRSIDARGKDPAIQLVLDVFINEPYHSATRRNLDLAEVSASSRRVLIAGAGPAGLFAALKLIEEGIKPVVLERGKDIRSRRRDLALLNKEGIINENSNYCFGEGGAGTYSDGKLYTRSKKRGDISRILNILVNFGADESILYDAHPHIGTNKLPNIISSIRKKIIDCGGEIHFENNITSLVLKGDTFSGIITQTGETIHGEALILATGHSARDIFTMLHQNNILIEAKPFALGVRVEHPQQLIDSIRYHCPLRDPFLPPASYSVVEQVNGKGVFSFCMCPGGIIAPASTADGELVVNGWSPSKRNNPFANSGMVVTVEPKDYHHLEEKHGPLSALLFQKQIEQTAFLHGGGKFVAPAQRLTDFTTKKSSSTLPDCSYLPGINPALLHEVLPPFIYEALVKGFTAFGKKMKGYLTSEAVVVATESRTSSPVRIPRDPQTLQHPQIKGLYPCGEGAGYAGGIVSAAMDGERVASMIKRMK